MVLILDYPGVEGLWAAARRVSRDLDVCWAGRRRVSGARGAVVLARPGGGVVTHHRPDHSQPVAVERLERSRSTRSGGGELPDIYALAAVDKDTFIAVGTDGAVLRTANGGRTWQLGRLRTHATLTAVAFRGAVGYIVGQEGALFATRDSGVTWLRVRLGTRWDLDAVFLASEAVHYVAGEEGRTAKSVDGGGRWLAAPPAAAQRLTALAFQSDRLGYAVGTGGIILETCDGGDTWRRLAFETGHTLTDIQFQRPGRLFVRPRWHLRQDDDRRRPAHRVLTTLDTTRSRRTKPPSCSVLPGRCSRLRSRQWAALRAGRSWNRAQDERRGGDLGACCRRYRGTSAVHLLLDAACRLHRWRLGYPPAYVGRRSDVGAIPTYR